MVFHDVPNDLVDGTDLVVFKSDVDSISEVALIHSRRCLLNDLLCKEDRVFWLIELLVAFLFILVFQERSNGFGVERDKVEHI